MSRSNVFLCVADIKDFVNSYRLSRRGYKSGKSVFDDILSDLKGMLPGYETAENAAYDMFGVPNLIELQKKIDNINNSGLIKFSSLYLSQAGSLVSSFSGIDKEQIANAFYEYIKKDPNINQQLKYNLTERRKNKIAEQAVDKIYESLQQIRTDNLQINIRKGQAKSIDKVALIGQTKKLLEYIKTGKGKNPINSTYKNELKIFLTQQGELESGSTWEITLPQSEVEGLSKNSIDTLSYYPYFSLTPEQKQIAINTASGDGQVAWENFKKHIISLIKYPNIESVVHRVFESLSPSFFIKEDKSGVIGALGELQMLLISCILLGTPTIPSGQLRNKLNDNAELGADILLNSTVGIQVKNYYGYGGGYHLKKNFSWNYLKSKIENNDMINTIDEYLSICCYNLPVTKREEKKQGVSAEQYRDFYKNFLTKKTGSLNTSMNAFFASNIDKIFTLSEAYEVLYGSKNQLLEGDYKNAFYIFGGRNIVPVSYIIKLLIQRIQELMDIFTSGDAAKFNNFYSSYDYSGNERWHYGSPKDDKNLAISSITNLINISLSLNIYLEDLKLNSGGPIIRIK